jgi:hypothetical protein
MDRPTLWWLAQADSPRSINLAGIRVLLVVIMGAILNLALWLPLVVVVVVDLINLQRTVLIFAQAAAGTQVTQVAQAAGAQETIGMHLVVQELLAKGMQVRQPPNLI